MALQPLGLLDRGTGKIVQFVAGVEEFRCLVLHSANGDGRSINRRTPGRSRAGRALISSQAASASADSWNRVRSASTIGRSLCCGDQTALGEFSEIASRFGHGAIDQRSNGRCGPEFDSILAFSGCHLHFMSRDLSGQCTARNRRKSSLSTRNRPGGVLARQGGGSIGFEKLLGSPSAQPCQ